MNFERDRDSYSFKELALGTGSLLLAGAGAFVAMRYKVCKPNQFMIRTGLGIQDMTVSKKGVIWPFQQYQMIDMNPSNCPFKLHNMSKENVEFELPMNFTVGPYNPDQDLDKFKNYARTLINNEKTTVYDITKSVVHGESRILSASMTIPEIFSDRDKFREMINGKIQPDLDQFGLFIYNSNIEELSDSEGNEYFKYRKQKALQSAVNDAKIQVSEENKKGTIGEEERKRDIRMEVSNYHAQATVIENENKTKMSESEKDYSVNLAKFEKEKNIANITAQMEAQMKEAELRKDLEKRNMEAELEKLRANEYTKTVIDAEKQIKETEGQSKSIERQSEAELYKNIKLAESLRAKAEAEAYSEKIKLEANALGTKAKLEAEAQGTKAKLEAEASGIYARWKAEADGLKQLFESSGNDPELVKYYLQLEFAKNVYPQIAEQGAKAIQGLNPKINVWSTGGNNDNALSTIKNLTTSVPPMMEFLKQNANIDLSQYFKNPKDQITKE